MSKKGKTKIIKCCICGREFETSYSGGVTRCPECSKNKAAALERPYTRDTVFLVCKWFSEGMTIPKIAKLLDRSEDNIRKALKRGGVYDVTSKDGVKL